LKRKRVIFVSALTLGLVLGILITAKFNFSPSTIAEHKPVETVHTAKDHDLQISHSISKENAFIKVGKDVGPAVVSISTEHVMKIRQRRPQSPFGRDDFFDRFFRDFFEEMPDREFRQRGLGSGVIIDEAGYVLTNEHVVRDADRITVTLPDSREFEGKLKGKDVRSDLAIIKIDAKGLPLARLGDSDKVEIGQWAIAIGNPFGYAVQSPQPTLTVGVISALDRSLPLIAGRDRDYSGLLQTDAAINPGNSGGPLVNIRGEVIGINVAIFSTTGGYQGVGFAIPINTAKEIVGALIEGKKVLYGWLGVSIQEINQQLADYFKLKDTKGVVVVKVLPDSPAEEGGLEEGDVIRSFNKKEIKDLRSLLRMVGRAKVGSAVSIDLIRDGKHINIKVEIGERPSEIEKFGKVSEVSWRGLEVSDITAEAISRYRLKEDNGVVVTDVEIGFPADKSGIIIGDVITSINKQLIRNMDDYNKIVSSVKGDVLIKTARGYTVVKEQATEESSDK